MQVRRLIPFIRVSSESQRENTSRDVQMAVIESWAKSQVNSPVELLPPVSVVESATCAADDRPEFMEALSKLNDADGMIFFSIDRFFRNTEEGLRIARERFIEEDKYFVSVSESIDISTDDGFFMFTIMLAVAQKEAQTIKRRFSNGRKAKRAAGGYIGGEAPYGWQPDGNGGLVENAAEQPIVASVVNNHMLGVSPTVIANRLNESGVKTRKGCQWTYKQVQSIIEKNRPKAAV